jgi:biopolymer transport protein ExbD
MRIPSVAAKRKARIEIVPLIDIMFFLLSTFVMVSLSMIQDQGMPVNLPAVHSAQADASKAAVSLSVTEAGQIYWDKEAVTLDTLGPRLKALAGADGEAKVFIHGDKKAEFGVVVQVLDAVRQAGIKHSAIRTSHAGNAAP